MREQSDPRGSRPARVAVDLSPRARTTLHRLVAKGTAAMATPAGIATLLIAFSASDPLLLILGTGATSIGAVAIWQLRRGRANAIVLNLLSALLVGGTAVYLPHGTATGLGASVIVFTLTGLPLLRGTRAWVYSAVMILSWSAHPMLRHFMFGDADRGLLAAWIIELAILVFGLMVVGGIREEFGRSESRYSYLFSHAPVAMWENDFSKAIRRLEQLRADGVEDLRRHFSEDPVDLRRTIALVETTAANPAASVLLGADPGELQGVFRPEILDTESERLFLEQFVAIWEGREGADLEYTGLRFDGTTFHGVLRWSNPVLGDRDPSRVVTAVTDLSGLKAVEEELESTEITSRALFDAIPDLLFLCDSDGTYLDYHIADPAAGLGNTSSSHDDLYVPPAEFLGKRPHDVLPAKLAQEMQIAIATALETDRVQTFEYDLPIAGVERSWEMRVSPLTGRSQVVALVRDITDRVRAHKELKRLVRSKDDFINAISHELRTPLTGIVGFAHLLMSDGQGMQPGDRRQMIEMLADQSADLSNIVEDLLVAAKADLGRLTIASVPVDLRAQVNQVLEAWDPKSVARIDVSGAAASCLGDPTRVRQIVRNLVTNALRYGGDRIRIEVDSGPVTGRVVVADDGEGIPPDQVEDAFLPYHRAARRDGLTAALGIGLPISRTLARLMGGDLTYRRAGGETRFELMLPRAGSPRPVTSTEASAGPPAEPVGILGRADLSS